MTRVAILFAALGLVACGYGLAQVTAPVRPAPDFGIVPTKNWPGAHCTPNPNAAPGTLTCDLGMPVGTGSNANGHLLDPWFDADGNLTPGHAPTAEDYQRVWRDWYERHR